MADTSSTTKTPTAAAVPETMETEAPATETPSTESPATKTPVTETPVTETPSTKTPSTKTPATETPATKTPATETPATKTPETETPATKTPATETPATKTPATDSPAKVSSEPTTKASPQKDVAAVENGQKKEEQNGQKKEEQNGQKKEEQNGHTKEDKPEESAEKTTAVIDPQLNRKIVQQIEYYFGNFNLPRDKFLSAEVKKDDGWILLTTMLKFARLANLTTDTAVIVAAIKEAEDSFMQVDDSNTKIRRSVDVPLPEMSEGLQEESIKRTVYCKGFPKDGSITLDILLEYFKPFGEFDSIRIRNYSDKTTNVQGFKGSVLVVFKTIELAKTFLERPPVQYKKTYLIRKWFADYLDEKKKEIEERKAKKQARLDQTAANGAEKTAEFEELPRGNFLRATGFKENTMREDIKAAVFDLTNDCAFVDFRKGDAQAFIRFSEAGSNKQILAALKDNLTVNEAKIELFLVEGDEEEEQRTKANDARRRSHASGPYTKKRKGGYGGRGGRGNRNKRQRT